MGGESNKVLAALEIHDKRFGGAPSVHGLDEDLVLHDRAGRSGEFTKSGVEALRAMGTADLRAGVHAAQQDCLRSVKDPGVAARAENLRIMGSGPEAVAYGADMVARLHAFDASPARRAAETGAMALSEREGRDRAAFCGLQDEASAAAWGPTGSSWENQSAQMRRDMAALPRRDFIAVSRAIQEEACLHMLEAPGMGLSRGDRIKLQAVRLSASEDSGAHLAKSGLTVAQIASADVGGKPRLGQGHPLAMLNEASQEVLVQRAVGRQDVAADSR